MPTGTRGAPGSRLVQLPRRVGVFGLNHTWLAKSGFSDTTTQWPGADGAMR